MLFFVLGLHAQSDARSVAFQVGFESLELVYSFFYRAIGFDNGSRVS